MTETELIKKIQELKKIRPRKDWVVLAKREIFREEYPVIEKRLSILEIFPRLFHYYRPVLATFVFLGIIAIAALGLAQNTLPGDTLYSVKRISEKGRVVFISEINKPKAHLELANKRLEELTKIAENNQIQKLAPAINEVQASVSQVVKDLKASKKITEEIVEQTKKIEESQEKVEALGVIVGGVEEFDNTLSQLVEREIKDLENKILSEEKTRLLEQAKADFENGNFSAALEKIWLISNN